MVMTVDVGPDGGIPVDVLAATTVAHDRAFAANEDDRFVVRRAPFSHRGKRVPDITFVVGHQPRRVPLIHRAPGPAAFYRPPRKTLPPPPGGALFLGADGREH